VLAAMLAEARRACERAADDTGCECAFEPLWAIPPIPFDERLVTAARRAVVEAGGTDRTLPSGPLHDAAEMARRLPAAMIFSSSTGGISHAKEEDTPEADLRVALDAFARTVRSALDMAASGTLP
jgi:acetylornithine deacetylase/succinyl-diaminopimelate desuccinylase-like protein